MRTMSQFLLGRGHELYQIEGVKKRYIDDREECREALQHVDELRRAGLDKRIPMVCSEITVEYLSFRCSSNCAFFIL